MNQRFISAFVIFLVSLMVIASYVYVYLHRQSQAYAARGSVVDLGYSSQWFESLKYGRECQTWMTCTQEGASLIGVQLETQGVRYNMLSENDIEEYGLFESCLGRDEGVSFTIRKAPYNESESDTAIVSIKSKKTPMVRHYSFELPDDLPLEDNNLELILQYEAELGDTVQVYEQRSIAQACR